MVMLLLHKSSISPSGVQLPARTTLLVTLFFSMLLLLLTTGSVSFFLESSFGSSVLGSFQGVPVFNATLSKAGNKQPKATPTTTAQTIAKVPAPRDWLRLPNESNFTSSFLATLAENGTQPCHNRVTSRVHLFGLPPPSSAQPYPLLPCGTVHELLLVSYDDSGHRRCHGGDYYETDLSSSHPLWKSRPPIRDNGDGSYSILLQVHPRYAGSHRLRIILLFSNFHGLHRRPERWARDEVVVDLQIEFEMQTKIDMVTSLSSLRLCRASDFALDSWVGRWTQAKHRRRSCPVNPEGRFTCLDRKQECERPWCKGPIGVLESNGLVYSAHCSFQLFNEDAAWQCLDKKWLFFWGDSNHVDTIRNFLNIVLGLVDITEVPRRFDNTYVRPRSGSRESVRITSMFNGHSNVSLNHQGLFSLSDPVFREQIASYFEENSSPDVVIMNSGLHDGMYWKHTHQFVQEGVHEAIQLWKPLVKRVRKKPRMIFRNTIATAAWARSAAFNPQKMEVFNRMFVEQLRRADLLWGVVDNFDLTYPWHYDNNCSDGVHYGKPPAATNWYGQKGHQYFVDLMLIHILMHAICI